MRVLITFLLASFAFGALPAQAALDGARLFARHCAVCHSERGEGVGVPLALPSFQAGVAMPACARPSAMAAPAG